MSEEKIKNIDELKPGDMLIHRPKFRPKFRGRLPFEKESIVIIKLIDNTNGTTILLDVWSGGLYKEKAIALFPGALGIFLRECVLIVHDE